MDAIFEKVEQDISSYDVAEELGIDHKTVLAHLKKTGYTKKLDIWVPHELTERILMNLVLICDSLLRRNETEPFLKKLITGNDMWITYGKNVRKRSWSRLHRLAKPFFFFCFLFSQDNASCMSPALGSGRRGLSDSYRLKTCGVP